MIERVLPFQFIKKSPLYGSYQGMNYRVTGPFAFWHTPEEKKEYQYFDYSEAGYEKAIQYLNEVFSAKNWRDEQLPWTVQQVR